MGKGITREFHLYAMRAVAGTSCRAVDYVRIFFSESTLCL
jgi:hypothetical protein